MSIKAEQVIKDEFEKIGLSDKDKDPQGIAISGGGIRSASFSIGVLQAIHSKEVELEGTSRESLFDQFDYLSTVSGGGFSGTCLSWFRTKFGKGFFPFGERRSGEIRLVDEPEDTSTDSHGPSPESILSFIRLHGKYLTPTVYLDFISAFGTVLRGMLISASYYFLFLTFVLVLVIGCSFLLDEKIQNYSSIDRYLEHSVTVSQKLVEAAKQWISEGQSGAPFLAPEDRSVIKIATGVGIAAGITFLFLTVFKAIILPIFMGREQETVVKRGHPDYFWRRIIQSMNGALLKLALLSVLLLSLPTLFRILDGSSVFGIAAGLIAAYFRFRTVSGKSPFLTKLPGLGSVSTTLAAGFFIYVLLLYAYKAATLFWYLPNETNNLLLHSWDNVGLFAIFLVLSGFLININYAALGRMYRDRLMETFMPGNQAVMTNEWKPAKVADGFSLSELNKKDGVFVRPYHLINTNAVMINDEDMRLKGRGGTSFLMSSLYVGSDPTGYVSTDTYMKYDKEIKYSGLSINYSGLTAATAMAVSGAAANPNTGVGGEGKTRNSLVSFLMTFFNIRLGFWGMNPNQNFFRRANILYPGIPALLGLGFKSKRPFLDLSDGGHFENLGLYELLRRRCTFIVASDAGADKGFNFADLGNAVERARVDFGVSIRFDKSSTVTDDDSLKEPGEDYDLQHLLPGTAGDKEFMVKFQLAKRGFALATIYYPAVSDSDDSSKDIPSSEGLLLYIKSTLTKSLPADLYGYKAKNPNYPDQTTADQFFDEVQFEAYRELGYQITKSALNDKFVLDEIENAIGLKVLDKLD